MKQAMRIILVALVPLSGTLVQAQQSDSAAAPLITKKWETEAIFRIPESVLYDSTRQVLYVSNINGDPIEKNGQGFIAKLGLDGKVQVLQWIKGLNAPKGMAIYHDTLFVADIDQIVAINLKEEAIAARYPASKAKFLNDVAVDSTGAVYVSDTQGERIYHLKDGKVTLWLDEGLRGPNGLYVEHDKLLVGTRGAVLRVRLADRRVSTFIRDTGVIDGLVPDGTEWYLISDWQSKTTRVHPLEKPVLLLDTKPQGMNAADIEYIISKKLLLIPTFFDNCVAAYELK